MDAFILVLAIVLLLASLWFVVGIDRLDPGRQP